MGEYYIDKARGVVQRGVNEDLWPSVVRYLTLRGRKTNRAKEETHQKKLENLAERQDRPLGWKSERSVTSIDDIELPHWIQQLLSLGQKHPVRENFNETHFLADIDIFLSDLKHRKVSGEALCEIEAVAEACSNWVIQTPSDMGVEKAREYLKGNRLVAVSSYDQRSPCSTVGTSYTLALLNASKSWCLSCTFGS